MLNSSILDNSLVMELKPVLEHETDRPGESLNLKSRRNQRASAADLGEVTAQTVVKRTMMID